MEAQPTATRGATAIAGMAILIVDDQPLQRSIATDLLTSGGYTNVSACGDGEEAVARCRRHEVDLVLLDLHMPGMDGFDVLRELGDLVRGPESLPVCLLTADGDVDRRREGLALGARDFLTKPVDHLELMLRVSGLLELRRTHQLLRSANDGLAEDVRRRTSELEASRLEMLSRLARTCEFRDDDTQMHAERIGHIAGTLARCIGLSSDRVQEIQLAAPLHDVGKVGIPDAILLKPGRLTPQERETMQRHAEIGARILSRSRSGVLRTAEAIALTHHERVDGKGYPYGLKGPAIPVEGRIVAIADVFDALTHARPYKKAWSVDEAVATIVADRGTHFDPEVTDAFLASLPIIAPPDARDVAAA